MSFEFGVWSWAPPNSEPIGYIGDRGLRDAAGGLDTSTQNSKLKTTNSLTPSLPQSFNSFKIAFHEIKALGSTDCDAGRVCGRRGAG